MLSVNGMGFVSLESVEMSARGVAEMVVWGVARRVVEGERAEACGALAHVAMEAEWLAVEGMVAEATTKSRRRGFRPGDGSGAFCKAMVASEAALHAEWAAAARRAEAGEMEAGGAGPGAVAEMEAWARQWDGVARAARADAAGWWLEAHRSGEGRAALAKGPGRPRRAGGATRAESLAVAALDYSLRARGL